jgi:hypothetical protein
MQQHKRQKRARESKYDDATDYLQNLCPIRSKWAGPCFPRMDSYERLQKRLRTSTGAMSCATFAKKLSILKGEVFFIDKDLLMGAYHGHEPPLRVNATCMMYVKAWAYYKGADGMAEAEIP